MNFIKKILLLGLLVFKPVMATDVHDQFLNSKLFSQEGIEYNINFSKDLPADILAKIEGVSLLILHKSRSPGSLGGLIKRAENDKILFEKVLKAFGYYAGKVLMEIDTSKHPVVINFEIILEQPYNLQDIAIECETELDCQYLDHDLSEILGLKPGSVITADQAIAAKRMLEKYLSQKGYPFIAVSNPDAEIDHTQKTIKLIYPVKLGGKCTISDTMVHCEKKEIDHEFIRNRLLWQKGDVYDARVVEKTRRFLTQTGLFDSINVNAKFENSEDEILENNGNNPKPIVMQVNATEAPPRSVSAGLHYDTTQKVEARTSWDHYNLMGHGENLGVSARISKVRSKARLHYDIPDFLAARQTWRNETYLMQENTRVYKGQTYELSSKLERQLTDEFAGSLGIVLESGHIQSKTNNKKVPIRLVGTPFELRIDTSNDLLNPTKGFRANGVVVPYTGKLGTSKGMLVLEGGASAYIPFATNVLDEDDGTLATFLKAGHIQIRNFAELPPNKRFYGGGNGSIRGYGFQKVGPVDKNSIPLGGQSMLEVGSELRCRFSENMGGVLFVEGGNVWMNNILNFKKKMLWGAGFGFRYYTDYAPIRVDLAFPLKRRKLPGEKKPYDAPYQFYVSIGQAF